MIGTVQYARVVFDSWGAGQSTGTRSCAALDDRALLFRVGRVCVDFILQGQTNADSLACGQIVNEDDGSPVANVPVRLGQRGLPSTTDELGQFAVTCHAEERPDILTIQCTDGQITCPIPSIS